LSTLVHEADGVKPLHPLPSVPALAREMAMGAAMACAWNARQMAAPALA
jgi:hypothetical protein